MQNILKRYLILLFCIFLIGACSPAKPGSLATSEPLPSNSTPAPDAQTLLQVTANNVPTRASNGDVSESTPSSTPSPVNQATSPTGASTSAPASPPRVTPAPDDWKNLPVIPEVSQTARDIYQRGLQMGRDPHAFSKVGDCQSITTYFLSTLETPDSFDLGQYTGLQQTVDWFKGSFGRESLSVKGGFNAAAVLSPLRADPKECKSGESPVACEYRQHNPSIALISLEEWWAGYPENYEKYLRQIIEYSIQQGVLPVVATKADNLEGNQLINQTIARLAWEYDIPMWNFWAAVQPLPGHGLIEDGFHLTHGNNFNFAVSQNMQTGWTIRNLTALEVLDTVRRSVANPNP
jgi:hypothetical protein